MNKIPETQLEPIQLNRLAAQRQLYTDAKVVLKFQVGLNVFGPLVLTALVKYFSMPPVYAVCCGIIVTFLNILCLTPHRQSLKKRASCIQELFDCDVLKLDWKELKTGSRLDIVETVKEYTLKYERKSKDYSKLQNWYPIKAGKLPIHLGRVICQRSNCWWGTQLMLRYAKLVLCILFGLIVIIIFLGLGAGFTLEEFFMVVIVPFVPSFILGIRQHKEYTEAAARLNKLKKYAEELWNKGVSGTNCGQLTGKSRDLQDEIYDYRRTCPLIFDVLYKRYREEMEKQMNSAMDNLVEDGLRSLPQ